jgi:hypothetical protein
MLIFSAKIIILEIQREHRRIARALNRNLSFNIRPHMIESTGRHPC